jgi:cytidylate kinase
VIVTISGKPGSGKSTVARALAARLELEHVSAGDFMRAMASERDISVLQLSAIAENDGGAIDREIDERSRTFGRDRDNFVIDARLAWYFIPSSTKVFLDVNLEVAAARIFGDRRGTETENVDLLETQAAIERRLASETTRYEEYYGIDWLDSSHFDLVVDTSGRGVAEIVDVIIAHLGPQGG